MAWWQTAKVGDFIVCVNDKSANDNPDMSGLKAGVVYTVRHIGMNAAWGREGVWLKEIYRPVEIGFEEFGEIGYNVRRFRPVDDTRLDVFRSLINPVREDA